MNIPFKTYKVGGCVRDFVLKKPVSDIDYVVVGATPEEMISLKFKQVGADFPVFLHPDTQDEYALARTERKNGKGYNGFLVQADPSVTLEDDLARRDFTMNAMAMDDDGTIIDPYNGLSDIQTGIIRHVSEAFADDPLRVLRGARFAARYDFKIAPETVALMKQLVDSGELDHLTPERIVVEFGKGFDATTPSTMFKLLHDLGAMPRLFPKAPSFQDENLYRHMDGTLNKDERWAVFLYTSFKDKTPEELQKVGQDMKLPVSTIAFSKLLLKLKDMDLSKLTPEDKIGVWQALDFRRRPEIAISVLNVKKVLEQPDLDVAYWVELNGQLKSVNEQEISKNSKNTNEIQANIKKARIAMCDLTDRNYLNESTPSI